MSERRGSQIPLYGIYGVGGCGRGVLPVAEEMLARRLGVGNYRLVFVDDAAPQATVNSRAVLRYDEFRAEPASMRAVCIAIAKAESRRRIADRCQSDRIATFSTIAANVVTMDDVRIGDGAILAPFVVLTSNIRIGVHFHCNLHSIVEHDCMIGDFVTFAPGVRCNGNVWIEDLAYIGSGAILRQGNPGAPLIIGRGATVGMGAIVTKSVPPGATVVGNPALPIKRRLHSAE